MILCYGSLNPDLVHHLERFPEPGDDIPASHFQLTYGGGAANVAVCLAAWGGEPLVAGHTLGTDPLGAWLLSDLSRRDVDTRLVRRDPGSVTPHTLVLLTPDGERTIIGSAYEGVTWPPPSDADLTGLEALVVDGYSAEHGAALTRRAAERNLPIIGLDVGRETALLCRLVVWSKHEHNEREAEGVGTVALTDGPRPVTVLSEGGRWELTPPDVRATGSVGAGDAFGAMCALGVARGWDLIRTIAMATAAGTMVATSGRQSSPPPLREVDLTAERLLTEQVGR